MVDLTTFCEEALADLAKPEATDYCATYGHPPETVDADGRCVRCGAWKDGTR